jgi:hypothetical protein
MCIVWYIIKIIRDVVVCPGCMYIVLSIQAVHDVVVCSGRMYMVQYCLFKLNMMLYVQAVHEDHAAGPAHQPDISGTRFLLYARHFSLFNISTGKF